jgi:AcrR family transcriptional regulator
MSATDINYDSSMSRWEPNARGRLEHAAMSLYVERGFEETTVAEIAERAGLAERTFFRHFVDKREVLFSGASELQALLVRTVAEAPASTSPIDAITAAIEAAGEMLGEHRERSRERQKVIDANNDLKERELIKLATLAAALAESLRQRDVKDPSASLAAEAGVAVFKIAFERWLLDRSERSLTQLIDESFRELRDVTSGA